jgi:glycosyltransferase involved in cell wall biosynthesis
MTRLLVFEDSIYRRSGGQVSTDRAFLLFASRLVEHVEQLTVLGRVDPVPGTSHYPLPAEVRFVGLPHYASLVDPAVLPALCRSLRTAWRCLGEVDVAWLMGPHPLSLALSVLAPLRGTRVVLGVRQDLPAYVRGRHPQRRWTHRAADLLEAAWRRRARGCPVVAVGPQLARGYAHAPSLLDTEVSLVPERLLGRPGRGPAADRLQLLSVGRLDTEKNPLLLADVLAGLRAADPRWQLVVCGEGPLRSALQDRLRELGVADHAELVGYLPVDGALFDVYGRSTVFLHVSWTEGVPQVLGEAWAMGLPVVATAVGGVPEAAGDAALLVPPGNAEAAVAAVARVAADEDLRRDLVAAGLARMRFRTAEATLRRLARFLETSPARVPTRLRRPVRSSRPAPPPPDRAVELAATELPRGDQSGHEGGRPAESTHEPLRQVQVGRAHGQEHGGHGPRSDG